METRVNKFKNYRKKLMEIEGDSLDSFSTSQLGSRMRTTINDSSNVLPMDQVMQKLCMDEEEMRRVKKAQLIRTLKPILIVGGIILTLAILVVFGIIVFSH